MSNSLSNFEARRRLEQIFHGDWITSIQHLPTDDIQQIVYLAESNPCVFKQKMLYQRVNPFGFGRPDARICERMYPAQILCYYGNVSTGVMDAVLEAFPEVVRIPRDNDGRLMIHDAITNRLSLDIVGLLLQRCPESLYVVTNGKGYTLLHLACQQRDASMIRYIVDIYPAAVLKRAIGGLLPLHECLRNGDLANAPDVFLRATRSVPSFASTKDSGYLPVQLILRCKIPAGDNVWRHVIRELLEAYPGAADEKLVKSVFLEVPHSMDIRLMVLAFHLAGRSDSNKSFQYSQRYPLHAILWFCRFSACVILTRECCLKLKDRLHHVDEAGLLPLHVALGPQGNKEVVPVMRLTEMIHSEPRAATARDPSTGLYPFMMAAAAAGKEDRLFIAQKEWLTLVYATIRVEPQVLGRNNPSFSRREWLSEYAGGVRGTCLLS